MTIAETRSNDNKSPATHTPGPWRLTHGAPHDDNKTYVYAPSGLPVAAALQHDERDANARLIAAAPELLDALHRAVDTIRSFHDIGVYARSQRDDDEAWAVYQHSPEMRTINAAIAKAQGSTPNTRTDADVEDDRRAIAEEGR